MTDLPHRIEEAREDGRGLRELDAEIARALGFGCVAQDPQASGDGWTAWEGPHFRSGPWQPLPRYTTSVDAALLLVPKGWLWRVLPTDCGKHWLCEVWTDTTPDNEFCTRAATPALAIAAASLLTQMLCKVCGDVNARSRFCLPEQAP